jgi:hypothetical protein
LNRYFIDAHGVYLLTTIINLAFHAPISIGAANNAGTVWVFQGIVTGHFRLS